MRGEGRVANWSRGARTVNISEREIDRGKTLTNRDIKGLGVENFEKLIGECVEGTDDVVKVGGLGTVFVIPITLDLECFSVILLEYIPLSFLEAFGGRKMAVKELEAEGGGNTCLRSCSTMDAPMDASVWDSVRPLDIVNRMYALSRTERVSLLVQASVALGVVVGGLHGRSS